MQIKTKLIQKLSQPPHDAFTLGVLERLDCNPKQRFKRSTVERMQRLMDPANLKKRKTRRLKHFLLLHIELTSINHRNNFKLLDYILKQTKRLDVIILYTSPKEWRQRIFDRLHTEDEPSLRAAVINYQHRQEELFQAFLSQRMQKVEQKVEQNASAKKLDTDRDFEKKMHKVGKKKSAQIANPSKNPPAQIPWEVDFPHF